MKYYYNLPEIYLKMIKMIYLLKNKNPDWGTMVEIVVRAKNEKSARKLAAKEKYGESPDTWLDSNNSSCEEVEPTGKQVIISKSIAE